MFSNSPCRETPKNALKKYIKNKKGTYVLFFASWRRCTSFSRGFFSVASRPSLLGPDRDYREQGPPCTQARTFAFWSTHAGGNARHASTELTQCIPELEKTAVAARNAFVGAQRPPKFTTRVVTAPYIWPKEQRMKNRGCLLFYDVGLKQGLNL